jgi:hypothetical protein
MTNTGNLAIGAYVGGGGPLAYFDGYISEARVWSTNQTQANIQANMAISLTGSESNLVALFKGNGNFNDATSNANNLTATNGAIATQAANPYNSTEYGIITKVTSTQLTIFTGTDYTIPNMTLNSPYYSTARAPQGFPAGRERWAVIQIQRAAAQQTSPTIGTWYNMGSPQLSIPTGEWVPGYEVVVYATSGTVGPSQFATLSTGSSSESDPDMTGRVYSGLVGANAGALGTISRQKRMPVTLTAQTIYYLNTKTDISGQTNINFMNDSTGGTQVIYAESAYI